jgi:hypothetical protein
MVDFADGVALLSMHMFAGNDRVHHHHLLAAAGPVELRAR